MRMFKECVRKCLLVCQCKELIEAGFQLRLESVRRYRTIEKQSLAQYHESSAWDYLCRAMELLLTSSVKGKEAREIYGHEFWALFAA